MRSLLAAIRAAMCAAGVPACVVLTIVSTAQPATTQDKDIEPLAKKSGCLECHSVDRTVKGPSYHDVAARYKGNPGARDLLIQKVKNGAFDLAFAGLARPGRGQVVGVAGTPEEGAVVDHDTP